MTGDEMHEIRRRLDFNAIEFAEEIGYFGNRNTLSQNIRRYENGDKPIPPWIATTVRAIDADRISDVIYKEVGEQLTFERIFRIAEKIVDHLVRETDMPEPVGDLPCHSIAIAENR